jgi:hypothetical protein
VGCEGAASVHCGIPERTAYAPGNANPQVVRSLSTITVTESEPVHPKCNLTQCRIGVGMVIPPFMQWKQPSSASRSVFLYVSSPGL